MDEGEIVSGGFVVACGDASVVLQAVDESFGEVPCFVGFSIVFARRQAIASRWDNGLGSVATDDRDEQIGIVAFVGDDLPRSVLGEQFFGPRNVMLFAGAEQKFYRPTLRVYGDVKFRAEAAAGAAERFGVFFFKEPAAC